jgi:hypothetical protein
MHGERSGVLSRRSLLTAVPVAVLAGCTSAEETPPGIGEVVLENRLGENRDVTLEFRQDDQEHETQVTVPGLSAEGPNREVVVDEWMGDHGEWELTVDAGATAGNYASSDFDERFYDYDRTDCIQLVIRIESSELTIRPQTVAVDCP